MAESVIAQSRVAGAMARSKPGRGARRPRREKARRLGATKPKRKPAVKPTKGPATRRARRPAARPKRRARAGAKRPPASKARRAAKAAARRAVGTRTKRPGPRPKPRPAPKPGKPRTQRQRPGRGQKPKPKPKAPAPRAAPRTRGPRGTPRKVSVFVGVSVDGFIARENGDLDFLDVPGDPKGEDYGYKAFVGEIDALVMGRKTFEKVLTFKSWPYGTTPVVVLTTRPLPVPPRLRGKVETMADRPAEVVKRLGKVGLRRLYLDGGRTIQGFLRGGVVDEITITRVPVLVGRGVPLFGALPADVRLKHVETRSFRSGMVQSTYTIKRRGAAKSSKAEREEAEKWLKPQGAAQAEPPAPAVVALALTALEVTDEPVAPPAPIGEVDMPVPEPDPAAGTLGDDE